jgi:hypothetical protein
VYEFLCGLFHASFVAINSADAAVTVANDYRSVEAIAVRCYVLVLASDLYTLSIQSDQEFNIPETRRYVVDSLPQHLAWLLVSHDVCKGAL